MGVMSRGNSGHKAKGVLSLPHNQEFGWNLHLNFNVNSGIRNLEFGGWGNLLAEAGGDV